MDHIRQSAPSGSRELLAAVLAASPDVIVVIDDSGVISFANDAARRVLGHAPEDWVGASALGLIHPDDREAVLGQLAARLSEPSGPHDPVVLRIAHADGRWVTVEASGVEPIDHAAASGMVVVIRDITSRLEAEQHLRATRLQLEFARSHDPVTRLPNRALLEERLEALGRLGRGGGRGAQLLLVKVADLDGLRSRYGICETESIVDSLGQSILREAGADDFVAVAGIGEFVVVVDAMAPSRRVEQLSDRLASLADTLLSSGRCRIDLRLAVGVTGLRPELGPAAALDRLGRAARWAAMTGSTTPVLFDEEFNDVVDERGRVAADVERGLAADEFELHYQPIRDLRTACVSGMEALLRWHHPDQGLLAAGRFLPAVEGTAAMVDIGERVVVESCEMLARWQRRFGRRAPSLAFNVSARQLRRGDFAERLQDALNESGADPAGLSIELTETHALEREVRAADVLRLVRELGVKIALDDFGTGYSSLHHLQKIQADVLKIDRSFVEYLGIDDGATAIVRAAIDLAAAFGTTTVAEGVTTIEQHQMLRSMGCRQIQGFLIAPALSPERADALLAAEYTDGPAHGIDELRRRVARLQDVDDHAADRGADVIQLERRVRPRERAAATPRLLMPDLVNSIVIDPRSGGSRLA